MDLQSQVAYEILICFIWLSYYLAIVTPPGSPVAKKSTKSGNSRECGDKIGDSSKSGESESGDSGKTGLCGDSGESKTGDSRESEDSGESRNSGESKDSGESSDSEEYKDIKTSVSWERWCNKCKVYKPERAHHCRKCGVCILGMDHHCPWLNNCVGHGNTPHFMRFLVFTQAALGLTIWQLSRRLAVYYEQMHMPAYLIERSELCAVLILWPTAAFVLLALFVLFIRCLLHLVSGKTQIEVWEYERIASQFHTERLWLRIRENYRVFHGKELGRLVSWNKPMKGMEFGENESENEETDLLDGESEERESLDGKDGGKDGSGGKNSEGNKSLGGNWEGTSKLKDGSYEEVVPSDFTPDDLVFPYDMGMYHNLVNALGPVYTWFLPWGRAKGNGHEFPKNDDDDQLNLPWPPDGGNVDFAPRVYTDDELRQMKDVRLIRKHLDPKSQLSRVEWTNDMGESLADYGVDVEAEGDSDGERIGGVDSDGELGLKMD